MANDPQDHLRRLHRENLWLRELLRKVAQDLERISSVEEYAAHTKPLLQRSQRIRRHLHRGAPPDWRATPWLDSRGPGGGQEKRDDCGHN